MQNQNSEIIKRPKKNKEFMKTLKLILKNQQYEGIIEYTEDKQGFRILNIEQFNNIVLSQHFAYKNFESFRRQLNSYGFTSNKNKNGDSQVSYINKQFNLESDNIPLKKICLQKNELFIMSNELIEQYNQLKQLQKNQQMMIERIRIMIKIQQDIKEKIKFHLQKIIKRQRTLQKKRFLALAFTLYVNIENQDFKQYIDNLIDETDFPFFHFLKEHPIQLNFQQMFQIIQYYFLQENIENKQIQQSFQELSEIDEKQSISNKSNISNYFDL